MRSRRPARLPSRATGRPPPAATRGRAVDRAPPQVAPARSPHPRPRPARARSASGSRGARAVFRAGSRGRCGSSGRPIATARSRVAALTLVARPAPRRRRLGRQADRGRGGRTPPGAARPRTAPASLWLVAVELGAHGGAAGAPRRAARRSAASCCAPRSATSSTSASSRRRSSSSCATSRTRTSTTRCRTRGARPRRGRSRSSLQVFAVGQNARHAGRPCRGSCCGSPRGACSSSWPPRSRPSSPRRGSRASPSGSWTWRAPEGRRLNYLEWILTRDSHVKEVKLFDLGPLVLGRYRVLFRKFFDEDRRLAVRRLRAGLAFGLLSLVAFYGMYALMAARAARGAITLGDLTLYIAVFRQGQGAIQAVLQAVGGDVRGRPLHVEPVRLPRHPHRRRGPAGRSRPAPPPAAARRPSSSRTSRSATRARKTGRCATSRSRSRRARRSGSSARTAPGSPRS